MKKKFGYKTANSLARGGKMEQLVIDSSCRYEEEFPILSVIVPVYRVEKYLARCLDSLLNQTYGNLEIICVNDASPEGEDGIIRSCCARDRRIKYIKHNENLGLFQARITGMKYASGQYFAFLDSDDSVTMDYYRILLKRIMDEKADMVIGDFLDEYEDGRREYYNYDNLRFRDIRLEGDEVYGTFMAQQGLWFGWHTVWNKVYDRHIWEDSLSFLQSFAEKTGHLIMTEDLAFSCTFFRFARKVVNAHNAFYHYFHHSGQSVSNDDLEKFVKNLGDVAAVFAYFKEFLVREGLYERYEKEYLAFLDLYIEFWTGNAQAVPEADRAAATARVAETFGKTCGRNPKDHFHYSMKTRMEHFEWYEDIKRSICSDSTQIVSFDIFDTLVLRPFFEPSDLFCLMNEPFNQMVESVSYIDFHKIRIHAEAALRKELSMAAEEVTLDGIYERIGEIFELSGEKREELKKLEVDLEVKYARPRKAGLELYELARFRKKQVVFVSDIYLPKEAVERILTKCGYSPDRLYLSSEYLMMKHTGNLFRVVLESEACRPEQVVHIGDNWKSDVEKPQEVQIRCHHLAAPVNQFRGDTNGVYTGASYRKIFGVSGKQYMGENAVQYLGIRCMLALAAERIFDNPYIQPFHPDTDFNCNPYYVGYYLLGMHLYAVADWLLCEAEKDGKETIHFVSRDGYLPQKAFEILKKRRKTEVNSNYLYISRKVTALLEGNCIADIQSYLSSFQTWQVSVRTPLETFRPVACEALRDNVRELGRRQMIYYGKTSGFTETARLGKLVWKEYINHEKAEQYRKKVTEHLKELIGERDVLFDLGYRANKEYILSSILDRPVDCYYIYTNESQAKERALDKSFSVKTFYDYTPSAYAAARELVFSKLAPSCIGYDIDHGMQPVFESGYNEHYFNRYIIGTMQQAALEFVEDFEACFADTFIPRLYRRFDASLPFEYFMNYSSHADRDMFACVTFEDDSFAGGSSGLADDWEEAVRYHRLDGERRENGDVRPGSGVSQDLPPQAADVRQNGVESNPRTQEPGMENLYMDGLFMKAFSWLNEKYPIGSKKRERLKKLVGMFVHG